MIEYLRRLLDGRDGGLEVQVSDEGGQDWYLAVILDVDTTGSVMRVGHRTRFVPWTSIHSVSVAA